MEVGSIPETVLKFVVAASYKRERRAARQGIKRREGDNYENIFSTV